MSIRLLSVMARSIWDTIKHELEIFDEMDYSKLNRQLELFDLWRKNGARGIIEAVTGFGKTFIAIIAIKRQNINRPNFSTIVVVPNKKLHEDWMGNGGYINTYKLKNVQVYVVNSYTMNNNGELHNCNLLILDEVHRYANQEAEHFNTVLQITNFNAVLALSATLDKQEKEFLERFDVPVVGKVDLKEAEAKGWISEFMIINYGVEFSEADQEESERLNLMFNSNYAKFEHNFNLMKACYIANAKIMYVPEFDVSMTGQQWREYWAKARDWKIEYGKDHPWSPDSIRSYAGKGMTAMSERQSFLHNAKNKIVAAIEIINTLDLKTIVFAESTSFVDSITDGLGDSAASYHSNMKTIILHNGIKVGYGDKIRIKDSTKSGYRDIESNDFLTWKQFKDRYPDCERLTIDKQKQSIIERFNTGDLRRICTAKALDEGFNVDDIELCLIASSKSKKRQQIQRMGRGLRKHGDKITVVINLFVIDTKDEGWLKRKLQGIPKSKINWARSIDHIQSIINGYKNETLNLI